jgi:hypothetical protein
MKDSADSSAFQRFAKAMRALVAVPKREIAGQISQKKALRKTKGEKANLRLNT